VSLASRGEEKGPGGITVVRPSVGETKKNMYEERESRRGSKKETSRKAIGLKLRHVHDERLTPESKQKVGYKIENGGRKEENKQKPDTLHARQEKTS